MRFSLYIGWNDRKGSALLIGIWLIIFLTVLAIVFVERIWRFSATTENIEQSNIAYYQANAAIEQALNTADKRTPWNISLVSSGSIESSGFTGTVITGSLMIPTPGYGNSEYDSNWNIISVWSPVQIVLPDGINDWANVHFRFRVPNIDFNNSTIESHAVVANTGVVSWILSSPTAVLFASGETNTFVWSEILSSNGTTYQTISAREWGNNVDNTSVSVATFYASATYLWPTWTRCAGYSCTLKLSLLRPIPLNPLSDGRMIPFLEYQIDFQGSGIGGVPDQFMHFTSQGWSNGFARWRSVEIPQITTSTALDFTVLQ